MNHLLLVDASGFAHRAYHVGGAQFRADGLPTWAITGFMGMMWRLLGAAQADQPTHAAAVFDAPGRTFRHKEFPGYKSRRPAREQELAVQLPYMRHVADAMGVKPVEAVGYEADDVIATLATTAFRNRVRTTIVSSDKDMLQLVRAEWIEVVDPITRARVTEEDVRGFRFGVAPDRVPDVQALAGDDVDDIPGIDGIGLKNAAALIRQFGSIEAVVEAAREKSLLLTAGQRIKLRGALEDLRLYKRLATLVRTVALPVAFDDLSLQPIMREHVEKLLKKLGAAHRFDQIFGPPQMFHVVEPMDMAAALEWWEEELRAPGQDVPELPQCGFYERRLTKNAVYVPARIYRESEREPVTGQLTGKELLRCTVGDEEADPVREWSRLCRHPLKRERYYFEIDLRAWVRNYAPDDPINHPRKPIDPKTAPLPNFAPISPKRGRNGRQGSRDRAQPPAAHGPD